MAYSNQQMGFAPGYGPGLAGPVGLGDMLQAQTADETDEQRRKRLLEMQQQQQRGGLQPLSASMGMTRATALSSAYGGAY